MPPDQGYATALRFRERRLRQGWRAVGRKIGFTNSGIWPRYEAVLDRGAGENVLGSPLLALGHLVELLAKQPDAPPLCAGEIVTTGTLTDAHPVAAGEAWSTEIRGLPLPGMNVRFQ
jgi:2-oxo-3-hexenedioate decarboxylase